MKMSKQIQHSQGCKVNLSNTSLLKRESKVPSVLKKFCSDLRGTLWFCQLHFSFTPYSATGSLGFRTYIEEKKKNPSLINPIRPHSTLILGCFTEPPARGRRREPPAVIPQISWSSCWVKSHRISGVLVCPSIYCPVRRC